jgi:hypothetical protein
MTDFLRIAAEHGLGLAADRLDGLLGVGAAFDANGDDRRFVEDYALAAHVNQRVGGAEVDGKVVGKIGAEKAEHRGSSVEPACRGPGAGRSHMITYRACRFKQ